MANLNLEAIALPFIDDELQIEGVPSYDEKFDCFDEKYEEFANMNRDNLLKKINYQPEGQGRK
jgi:hypothetical protein